MKAHEPEIDPTNGLGRLLPLIAIVPAVMLFAAQGNGWPYGYFVLLRWVVCAAACLIAFVAQAWRRSEVAIVFGFVAILFNPIAPVYLNRSTWAPIDLAAAVVFLLSIGLSRLRKYGR